MHIPFLSAEHNVCESTSFCVRYGMCAIWWERSAFCLIVRWYNPASGFHKDRGRGRHPGNGTINWTMKWRASFAVKSLSTLERQITTSPMHQSVASTHPEGTAGKQWLHISEEESVLWQVRDSDFFFCQNGWNWSHETGRRNHVGPVIFHSFLSFTKLNTISFSGTMTVCCIPMQMSNCKTYAPLLQKVITTFRNSAQVFYMSLVDMR